MSKVSSMTAFGSAFNERRSSRSLMIMKGVTTTKDAVVAGAMDTLPITHEHRGKKMMDNDDINFTVNPITGTTQTFDKTTADAINSATKGLARGKRHSLEREYNTL